MSRGNYKFNRCDSHEFSNGERVNWLDRFADNLENKQTSVDVGRSRSHSSIVDQINSIVSNQPRHATVESMVQDMQERVGLKEYLNRVSQNNSKKKIAQNEQLTSEQQKEVIDYINYLLKQHNGLISLPAILFELNSAFEKRIDDDILNSDDTSRTISNMIVDYQQRHPSTYQDTDDHINESMECDTLFDDDNENNDYFSALNPNVEK